MGASQSDEASGDRPITHTSPIPNFQTSQQPRSGMKRNSPIHNPVRDPEAPPPYEELFGGTPQTQPQAPPHIPQQHPTTAAPYSSPPSNSVLFPDVANPAWTTGQSIFQSNFAHPEHQINPLQNVAFNSSSARAAPSATLTWQQQEEENELRMWFSAVDENNDGYITSEELRQALLNDNWTPFNMDTIRMMLKMFDRNLNDRIEFDEFAGLKKYVQEWKKVFDRYDVDHSGTIDVNEIQMAFTGMNYNFSLDFCRTLCRRFGARSGDDINLDAFIYACAMVNALSKEHQKNPQPSSFEAYLTAWINRR